MQDFSQTFQGDDETGYVVRSVALLRCAGYAAGARVRTPRALTPSHRGANGAPLRRSEDAKSLSEALLKYKKAVEASVEGGMLELGLKGFSHSLVQIATRDSVKARNMGGACGAAQRERRGDAHAPDVLPQRWSCATTTPSAP